MIPANRSLATDRVITPAETRVAIAYTLGDIGKEVADRLGIAHGTVVRHTQNILREGGVQTLHERAGGVVPIAEL